MFQRAIVRAPGENFAAGVTTANLGPPVLTRALEQHQAYCAALEHCGLTLSRLLPDAQHPDAPFVEDIAILTERCAILTRPGAASRAGEVDTIRPAVDDFYPDSYLIAAPGTLDGGDVCQAGQHFFIGLSGRTNNAGARQLAQILASFDYTSSLVDIRRVGGLLHLKSGVSWLGDGQLLVTASLRHEVAFARYDLITAPAGEEYAANCVRVNTKVLIAAGYPIVEALLQQQNYQVIPLEMSEFQKMDGGLSCLSLRF